MVRSSSANFSPTAPARVFPPPWATALTSVFPPPLTLTRATSKPFTASSEDEFFDLETFHSRSDFLAKAALYQLYFNLARPNSHKQGLSPWQIIHHLEPCRPLRLCLLAPVFLDHQLDPQGGYLVPRHPYPCRYQNWL